MVRRECGSDRPRAHPATASRSHLMRDYALNERAISGLTRRLAPVIITAGTQPSLPSRPSLPDRRGPHSILRCVLASQSNHRGVALQNPLVRQETLSHTHLSRKTREVEEECTRPAFRRASPDADHAAPRAVCAICWPSIHTSPTSSMCSTRCSRPRSCRVLNIFSVPDEALQLPQTCSA